MLRIAVCIKSVLTGAQEGAERNEKSTGMNPADLYALETALTADLGKREVSVFSMGPQATAGTLLMDAARLGADRLFLRLPVRTPLLRRKSSAARWRSPAPMT